MTTQEKEIIDAVSADEMWKTVTRFASLDRTSGTEGEFEAVEYIRCTLAEWGIPVEVHEFEAYLSYPGRATLAVLGAGAGGDGDGGAVLSIPIKTRSFAGSTPDEGIVSELIYVPAKRDHGFSGDDEDIVSSEADYQGLDVRGKIVLGDRGGPDAVRWAERFGAIGHIHLWPSDEDVIHEMIVSPVWGTPTDKTKGDLPTIPAVAVKRADGLQLLEMLREANSTGKPVMLRLVAKTTTGWRRQLLPVATIRGARRPEKFVLAAGHLDSWYVGVTDNATGNAACLELARVLHQHRDKLGASVKIAWWPGHSTGRYAGSTWFADNFWEDLRENCLGYINIDSPGSAGATDYEGVTVMEENRAFTEEIVRELAGQKVTGSRPVRAGDQSFWGIGVSSFFMLLSNLPPEKRYAVGGSGMNWFWHSEYDIIQGADKDILLLDTKLYLLGIIRLVNSHMLPFRAEPMADEFVRALADFDAVAGAAAGTGFDLAGLRRKAAALKEIAHRFDEVCAEADAKSDAYAAILNEALLALGRTLIPVNYTERGPFEHDPATPVPPLPGLNSVRRLAELPPDSDEAKFLKVRLVRERNRVAAALNEAGKILEAALDRFRGQTSKPNARASTIN